MTRTTSAMPPSRTSDRRLLRQLTLAVLLKLLVLFALWWFFVRGQRVAVDAAAVATQQLLPGPATGVAHATPAKTSKE